MPARPPEPISSLVLPVASPVSRRTQISLRFTMQVRRLLKPNFLLFFFSSLSFFSQNVAKNTWLCGSCWFSLSSLIKHAP